jgi:hypothetical protein
MKTQMKVALLARRKAKDALWQSQRPPFVFSKMAFRCAKDGSSRQEKRLFFCNFRAFSSIKHVVFVERLLVTNCMIGYYA